MAERQPATNESRAMAVWVVDNLFSYGKLATSSGSGRILIARRLYVSRSRAACLRTGQNCCRHQRPCAASAAAVGDDGRDAVGLDVCSWRSIRDGLLEAMAQQSGLTVTKKSFLHIGISMFQMLHKCNI